MQDTASHEDRLTFRIGQFGAFIAPLIFIIGAVLYFVVFDTFDMTALTASAVLGLIIAALFAKPYQGFWDGVISGLASPVAMTVVVILLVVGPLATMLETTGVSEGFVWLATEIGVSGGLFIGLVFLAGCAISISTGSSLGTMFTAFPIFYPAGAALGADPVLLAGAIFSGAMFGDNLAPISDTTIISSSTQRYRRKEGTAEVAGVVASRAKYSLTAAGICLVLFSVLGSLRASPVGAGEVDTGGFSPLGLIMVLPVILLIAVAFWKRNLFLAITVGLVTGTLVGLVFNLITPADILSVSEGAPTGFLYEGVNGMLPLIALSMSVFGMTGVLRAAGIFEAIVGRLGKSRFASGPVGAETSIALGQTVTTALFAGVVGPSLVTFGSVVDEVGAAARLHPYRRANVMECFGMGFAAIVPALSAFLFIMSQLTEGHANMPALTPLTLVTAAFYPMVIALVMIVSIVTGWGRRFESAGGAPVKRIKDIEPFEQETITL